MFMNIADMTEIEHENQIIDLFADFMIEKSYSERSMYNYYLDKFAKSYAARLLPKLIECFSCISQNNSDKIDLGKYNCVTRIADYKGKIYGNSIIIVNELIAHSHCFDYDIYVTVISHYLGRELYNTTVHVGKVGFEQPIPDCAYKNNIATKEIACFHFFADKIKEARASMQIADLNFFVVDCLQMLITIKDTILQHNE